MCTLQKIVRSHSSDEVYIKVDEAKARPDDSWPKTLLNQVPYTKRESDCGMSTTTRWVGKEVYNEGNEMTENSSE